MVPQQTNTFFMKNNFIYRDKPGSLRAENGRAKSLCDWSTVCHLSKILTVDQSHSWFRFHFFAREDETNLTDNTYA